MDDFDESYFTVANGSSSNFTTVNGAVYKATITPATDGNVTINVDADETEDLAGNGNATAQYVTLVDTVKPTITISSSVSNPTNAAFTATFTFSKYVNGFEISDITVGNGTASDLANTTPVKSNNTGGGLIYTALITPTTDGIVTLDVVADAATDTATNGNTVAAQFSTEYDSTKPTLTITSTVANPTNNTFTTTFTFSEAVTGFDIADIALGNATTSNFTATSSTVYTALITPTIDGNVTIDIAADVAADAATNGNIAATQFTTAYDIISPTVTITSTVVNPTNAAFITTVTFSEAVIGFDITDITLSNATASNFTVTSSSVYTALITPTTDGIVTVDVAADVATDTATNGNAAATQFSTLYDRLKPTVAITSTVSDPTNSTFTTTFTFSEAVTGFVVGDITLGNSTASNFTTTSSSIYTASITPIADGTVTVDIAADAVVDTATNGNTSATQFSVLYDATTPDRPIVVAIDSYTCSDITTTTAAGSLIFIGTAEANSTVELFINNTSIGTTVASATGNWTFDHTSVTLADATYNITATAKDASNNTSDTTEVFTISIDTKDWDEHGNPDFCDLDDDNDGVLDVDDNSYLPNPDQARYQW